MSSIFISYRRVGALVHARALFERLRHEFGPNEVFIDLEGVDYGLDFIDILNEQLNGCQVMLAVIDPQWATATDRQGRRRIDREFDYVRVEIVTALGRGIRTVPVLIDGAEMPDASDLPEPLRPLTRRNALMLDFNRFDAEISRLIAVIRKLLSSPSLDVALKPDLVRNQEPELREEAASALLSDQREKRQAERPEMTHSSHDEGHPLAAAPKVATTSASAPIARTSGSPNRGISFKRRAAYIVTALALAAILFVFLVRGMHRVTPAPAAQGLVKSLEPSLIVGQYFGEPLILATLRVENPGTTTVNITDVHGTLTANGHSFIVLPISWTIANSYGPFVLITGPLPIFAAAKLDLRIVMVTGANFSELYQKTSALPEYKAQLPCVAMANGTQNPMTESGFQIAKEFSEAHFGWYAGEWNLRIDVATENGSEIFTRSFSLSSSEIDKLRDSIVLMKQCLTVAQTLPLAQDGTVSNFLSK